MLRRLWSALQSPIRQRGAAVFLSLAVAVGVIVGVAAAALIGAVQGLSDLVSWVGGRVVEVGASMGSSIPRHPGLGEDRVRSLVAAGAGAAIGASFNAPIAGMLFAMEVILGNFAVRHLSAVVVSSVAAAVTTRSIVGEDLILRAFPYRVGDVRELALYAL